MSILSFTWEKLSGPALPRSSHSITVVGQDAYIFGGEIQPREPCDNIVHKISLQGSGDEQITGQGDVPPARVGHVAAVINDHILIFGGRGGKAMTPLEEQGGVYSFSIKDAKWTFLKTASNTYPEARSYHCATSTPTHFIIHAGCGAASGSRFNDTWAFDVNTLTWTQLPDAPGDPRGGSAICYAENKLWRFGGYNGKTEIGGSIDSLDLGSTSEDLLVGTWNSHHFDTAEQAQGSDGAKSGPGARSVCALLPLPDLGLLVTFLGEGNPSPTGGHDAAGHFWGDTWTFDPSKNKWHEVQVKGEHGCPGERGWFAACNSPHGPLLWGGINGENDRLSDGWRLVAHV